MLRPCIGTMMRGLYFAKSVSKRVDSCGIIKDNEANDMRDWFQCVVFQYR